MTLEFSPASPPRDIAVHAVDAHSKLYVDLFVFYVHRRNTTVQTAPELCGRGGLPAEPRPARSVYSKWPSDLDEKQLEEDYFGGLDNCEHLHKVWSMAWWACAHCETRKKDQRRRVHMPSNFTFPLQPCMLGGMRTLCPAKPFQYLSYIFGDPSHPPFRQTLWGKVLHLSLLVASLVELYRVLPWAVVRWPCLRLRRKMPVTRNVIHLSMD